MDENDTVITDMDRRWSERSLALELTPVSNVILSGNQYAEMIFRLYLISCISDQFNHGVAAFGGVQ